MKNLKLKKKLLSLLLASTFVFCKSGIEAKASICDKGDIVKTTSNVNMRLDDNIDAKRILTIKKNQKIYRILETNNNWSLVLYKDILGYVSNNYIENTQDMLDDGIYHFKIDDYIILMCDTDLYLDPCQNINIDYIEKDKKIEVIAYTDNNSCLVKYNNKIGYIDRGNTMSLLEYINNSFPNVHLNSLNIKKNVYTKVPLNIRSEADINSLWLGRLAKGETAMVLKEFDDWYFVKHENGYGYIAKKFTNNLEGIYIIIDLSDQKLFLYENNQLLLTSDIVTGKDETQTRVGVFSITSKEENRYLIGDDYKAWVNYWMPFNGGIGLHDATWRTKFGGEIYKNKGSHGCVNLPFENAEKIYENISVGTKVLVRK